MQNTKPKKVMKKLESEFSGNEVRKGKFNSERGEQKAIRGKRAAMHRKSTINRNQGDPGKENKRHIRVRK